MAFSPSFFSLSFAKKWSALVNSAVCDLESRESDTQLSFIYIYILKNGCILFDLVF